MTKWYNLNPKIDIRAINLSKFSKEIERELNAHPGSFITIGVEERPYFLPNRGSGRRSMSSNIRTTTSTSQIAAGHEFGLSNLPRRSFLETTARRFAKSNLQKIAGRNYTYVKSFIKALTSKIYDMIIDCFLTSGWGSWKPLTREYKQKTGRTEPPLIDTGQLMSAVYAQFEGFTVSGKQVGGYFNSDFYNIDDAGTEKLEKQDKKEVLKLAEQFKAWRKVEQSEAVTTKFVSKYQKEKESIDKTEESIRNFYSKRVSRRYKNEISFSDMLAKRSELEDLLVERELRKRGLI